MKLRSYLTSKQFKVTVITLHLILLILGAIDYAFYNFSRRTLIDQQNEKMKIQAENISASIQLSRKGEDYMTWMLGQNLRSVALYAQSNLDPDIEKVTNEQLDIISKKAGIDHITLMKRSGDDIIGYKSSDPKELGMTTKNWRGYWFEAFNQLLDHKNVDVPVGQILPNYWAGPMNTSMTNTQNVDLWGYYYDGTTNYIIDPFVHDEKFREYQKDTGVDAMISQIVQNSIVTEVSVFNPPIFLKEQEQFIKEGVVWYSDREILFGSYNLKDARDDEYVKQAYESQKELSYETTIHGTSVLKSFIPLHLDYPVVVGLVADLTTVNATMHEFQKNLLIIISITTILGVIFFLLVSKYYSRNKEVAFQSVRDVFVENIDQMFSSIKEQRHDFNNHLSTIHSLVQLGEYDELKKYTKEIVGETMIVNDIININSPAISALIQAKITQAMNNKILFEHDIINMGNISLGTLKSTDLVKILSNLIDNAFDAVENNPEEDRYVVVNGYVENDHLCFGVFNKGTILQDEQINHIFEKGFSTKSNTEKHSGLGLYIVNTILKKYNGNVFVEPLADGNLFKLRIPLYALGKEVKKIG